MTNNERREKLKGIIKEECVIISEKGMNQILSLPPRELDERKLYKAIPKQLYGKLRLEQRIGLATTIIQKYNEGRLFKDE